LWRIHKYAPRRGEGEGDVALGGMGTARGWPRRLVPVAVAGFWLLVLLAGWVNPGYRLTRDYISALASRGADQAWIGVTALVVLPLAHLAAAYVIRPRARWAAGGLALSVVAGLLVAADRISCPGGAAGCSTVPRPRTTDWMDAVHGRSVAAYGGIMVLVLVLAALELWQQPGFRRFAVVSAVLAPVSGALLIAAAGGGHPGGPQRLWLLVNTGWLVGAARVVR
jgi:hypothetical protein